MLTRARLSIARMLDRLADHIDPSAPVIAYRDLRPRSAFTLGLAQPDGFILTERGKQVCDLAHKLDLDVALCRHDVRSPLFLIAHDEIPSDNRAIVLTNFDRLRPPR